MNKTSHRHRAKTLEDMDRSEDSAQDSSLENIEG